MTDADFEGTESTVVTLQEALPPAKQYFREEWRARTWWGRFSVPPETALVALINVMISLKRRVSPGVYRIDVE